LDSLKLARSVDP
jgi:hypothetical protein